MEFSSALSLPSSNWCKINSVLLRKEIQVVRSFRFVSGSELRTANPLDT
jgi:hypothetical protein